jgi:alpha-1,3/alpha-1,6-mannosyltransferase
MSEKREDGKKKTIVFLHPDLGIGGAERLVVDAAVGLQKRGHRIVIFTSHCDPKHCFDEARDGKPPPPVPFPLSGVLAPSGMS